MCKRMKVARIKKIADRIATKYCMPAVIVELLHCDDGRPFVQLRSELTRDEGGNELIDSIFEKLHYYVSAMGQCVYHVYQN